MSTAYRRVAVLSVALFFFSVPHTLEDFALGEPLKRGVPAPVIAFVVSSLLALQALGLSWLGQRRRLGLWVHAALGLFWAVAGGAAQFPELLSSGSYRSGPISAAYVLGLVGLGAALFVTSLAALKAREPGSPA